MKYFALLMVLIGGLLTGCEEKSNDWEVQPEYAGLFRPLVFAMSKTGATTLEVKYTKVVSANKYIFEFSEDSLLFNSIVSKVEVLADTLTPFAKSSTATKVEYRTIFKDLNASAKYSVRMQAIDTVSGLTTQYSAFYFETSSEQIINDVNAFTDKVDIYWAQTDRLTHLTIENSSTGEVVVNHTLSAEEIANATATIGDLGTGTTYIAKLYNDTRMRGSMAFKTLGMENSAVVYLQPTDIVADVLAASVAEGKNNVTLTLTGSEVYDFGTLTVPAGITNLSITGISNDNGVMPSVILPQFRLTDILIGKVVFENIKMTGIITQHLVYLNTAGAEIESVSFLGCQIDSYNSLVRASNTTVKIGTILFDDCLVNNIGGYGVVNIGGSTPTVNGITFKNSTLTDLTTQLMDVRAKVVEIELKNCTFCNLKTGMAQLLRFDVNNLPLAVKTADLIISGTNNGAKINSLSYDGSATSLNVSFAGSYRTTDLIINKYEFSEITIFNGTTYDLFVDPDNRDFSIKSSSGFAGRGTAGDPRWF